MLKMFRRRLGNGAGVPENNSEWYFTHDKQEIFLRHLPFKKKSPINLLFYELLIALVCSINPLFVGKLIITSYIVNSQVPARPPTFNIKWYYLIGISFLYKFSDINCNLVETD